MGERTLAIGSSRAETPHASRAVNDEVLPWSEQSYMSKMDVAPRMSERTHLQHQSHNIAEFILHQPSADNWEKITNRVLSEPAYTGFAVKNADLTGLGDWQISTEVLVRLAMADPSAGALPHVGASVSVGGHLLKGGNAFAGASVSEEADASAVAVTQEQSAANCCPCPPCNLL
jgi:hypothetical protein